MKPVFIRGHVIFMNSVSNLTRKKSGFVGSIVLKNRFHIYHLVVFPMLFGICSLETEVRPLIHLEWVPERMLVTSGCYILYVLHF